MLIFSEYLFNLSTSEFKDNAIYFEISTLLSNLIIIRFILKFISLQIIILTNF